MAQTTPLHDETARSGATFMEESGWEIPAHFQDEAEEYQQARTGAVVFDESHRGKLELTGGDAASFLHNLCTNDVNGLPVGGGCETFFTTAHAKVVAHGILYHMQLGDGRHAVAGSPARHEREGDPSS